MSEYLVDRIAEDGEDFKSSNIDILGYDRESETLYVEFHSSGTVYSYAGVKESTFDMLVNADSVGSFYARHIKGTYTGDIAGEDVITLREEEDPIQPERKWLTTDGDESPFALTEGEADTVTLNAGGLFITGTLNVPVMQPAKYGVKWSNGTLTFEPLFEALSEADALAQFNAAVTQVMPDADVKILAVTHYFE